MKHPVAAMLAVATLLLGAVPMTSAQTAAPATYSGANFPGGPDSLRALVYRSTQVAPPGTVGLAVVQMELKDGREPGSFKFLGPEPPKKSALSKAVPAALAQLQARMPAWQPAPEATPNKKPTVLLALRFGAPMAAQPYAYADQEPFFAYLNDLPAPATADRNSSTPVNFPKATYSNLAAFIQRRVRYPADALRNQQQGQVNIYFEVAENGAIENAEIVSSAGSFLDEEVLGMVKRMPAATKPALLQGRPVRIYYLMPVTFKIQ